MKLQAITHHENALQLRALRNRIISSNIANADTPGYKARDIDFQGAFESAKAGTLRLSRTNPQHQATATNTASQTAVKYRIPSQPTLDGNTVETDVEQAAYAENAIQYRASLTFLNGAIQSLRYALKGGD